MKIFKFFKKKKLDENVKAEKAAKDESVNLIYANVGSSKRPVLPSRPKALPSSKSYHNEKHVYHVFDPFAEEQSPSYSRTNVPQSQSFPNNIVKECFSSLSNDSITNSSKISCYCPNCQELIRPIIKSTSPRIRNMIKTNPWFSPTSRSNSFSHTKSKSVVSPYATSESIFSHRETDQKMPDTSIDSGIFDSSPHTYDITSASSCSDDSICYITPGCKRYHTRGNQQQPRKLSAFQPVNKNKYIWQPYNQTNFTFELPRTNINKYLIHSESQDNSASRHQRRYRPPPPPSLPQHQLQTSFPMYKQKLNNSKSFHETLKYRETSNM